MALPADALDLDGDTTEPLPVDADGNERVVNAIVDMGAYEGACTIVRPTATPAINGTQSGFGKAANPHS